MFKQISLPVAPKQAGFGYHIFMTICPHILVVEDDGDINDVIATALSKAGYCYTQAFSGSEGRLLFVEALNKQAPYDLIVTDLMLPGISGEEFIREIRAQGDTPLIVVSARCQTSDKVELLKLGADDYLTKPFDLDELLARVAVQLRNVPRKKSYDAAPLYFKDWMLDNQAHILRVSGTLVRLTPLEYSIVETLVQRPKKVFTKQELFRLAWNEEAYVEDKVINVHISNIRSKLKKTGTDTYLETVWGIGFKLAD